MKIDQCIQLAGSRFIKSYTTDFVKFKKRLKESGLGNSLQAKNYWRYLLGSNKFLRKKTLKRLTNSGIKLDDLTTLKELIKSSIILSWEE
jgi:hypothetical protein